MALSKPTIQEIRDKLISDLINTINAGQTDPAKQIDPNMPNSFILAFVESFSGAFDDNYSKIDELLNQLFPDTSTGEWLDRWASYFGLSRKSAVKSTGNVVFQGDSGEEIPNETQIERADGVLFEVIADSTISSQNISITSAILQGSQALITTSANHNLASGVVLSISGFTEPEYNVSDVTITVISATQFLYNISGAPDSPATGTGIATCVFVSVPVEAVDFGKNSNSASGTELTLTTPILGVNDSCFVDFSGLRGGLDVESDDDLRIRLIERTSNLTAPFTNAGIKIFAKEKVDFITRIWVKDATPNAGKTTIWFVNDNDANIIPSTDQCNQLKDAIIDPDTGIKPANMSDASVIVVPITALTVNFQIGTLSVNTQAMKDAITGALKDLFTSELVAPALVLPLDAIKNAIYGAVDDLGNQTTFSLASPSSNVTPASDELPVLGTITFV